ncbi:MAG: TerC family protein [Actinomycetota bacterium]
MSIAALAGRFSSARKDNFVDLHVSGWAWVGLLGVIGVLLLFDILVLHRVPKVLPLKRAAVEWFGWTAIGLAFTFVVIASWGQDAGVEYLSGYLIEQSLSIDNVFVWALILSTFAVPVQFQHRVLFWGIFGALVLRAAFILAGVALIEKFDWVLFVFGGFLVYTGVKLAFSGEDDEEFTPEKSRFLRILRRVVPSTPDYDGQKLFVQRNGKRLATPLLAVLVLVESTDVVFAVDSVPAVLAVSREQFIVFSSNAFAIMGLRALYFLLADMRARFSYLQQGLAVILGFVGGKMVISRWVHIDTWLSLMVIVLVLVMSVLTSMRLTRHPGALDTIESVPSGAEPVLDLPPGES